MTACPPQRIYCPLEVAQSRLAGTRGLLSVTCTQSRIPPALGGETSDLHVAKAVCLGSKAARATVCVLEQQISQVSIRGRNSTLFP